MMGNVRKKKTQKAFLSKKKIPFLRAMMQMMQVDDVPSGFGMTVRGRIDASPNKLSAVYNTHNEEVIVSYNGEVAVRFIILEVMRDVKSIQFKGELSKLSIETRILDNLVVSMLSEQRPDFWMEIDIGPYVRHRYSKNNNCESNGVEGDESNTERELECEHKRQHAIAVFEKKQCAKRRIAELELELEMEKTKEDAFLKRHAMHKHDISMQIEQLQKEDE